MTEPRARVLVAGASGLIGRALLNRLAGDARVGPVTALVRRTSARQAWPRGCQALAVDYTTLGTASAPGLPLADWAFCCLGTTIKMAGSQAAFRAVDFDAVLAFARACRAAGATRFGLVSAMGASERSSVFYNRVKGEVEQELKAQGWPHLVIARPSLLLGERSTLGQPTRPGEQLAQRLMPALGWLIPKSLRPITDQAVAAGLLTAVAEAPPGTTVIESGALAERAARA